MEKGHEFVGKVIQLHPSASSTLRDQWIGQRVCGDINIGCCNFATLDDDNEADSCNKCGICNDKLNYNKYHSQMSRNHCPNRTVLGILNQDGTFAEYMIVPLSNLHVVPDGMKNEVAVFAEPLAAACRVVEQGFVQFCYDDKVEEEKETCESGEKMMMRRCGDRVAILGDGKLGLCIAEILGREYLKAVAKCRSSLSTRVTPPHPPILFGKHQHKLDLVADSGVERRLVTECYNDDDGKQGQISSNYANQFDVVIDATGNPNGLTLAMSLCRPMGRLVLKSTCAAGTSGFNSAPIVVDELQVVGSRCGPIDKALELLEGNSVESVDENGNLVSPPLRMEKYITEIFPLSRVRDALECAAKKTTMKVQLIMGEEECQP